MTLTAGSVRPGPLPLHSRLLGRVPARRMTPHVCRASLEAGLDVALADTVVTRADHYLPLLPGPAPTLLVRTPYGRGFP